MNTLKKHFGKGMSYEQFYKEQESLAKEGKTSGELQLDNLINYTKINAQRMRKWDKRYQPSENITTAVQSINESEKWLLLTESWCGDAAQVLAQIAKIANKNENIDLEILYRDENLELMDQFLTNGGRSIPKLIRVNSETGELINHWGPRTAQASEIVKRNKEMGQPYDKELHLWYAKHVNESFEEEFKKTIDNN
ncbi:MAG: thioredoxin family protein [Flavobacteriales bacterium]|jgi:hypothetical protein|nr:thioredoxin family protein [Flavobacteriales bacterium]